MKETSGSLLLSRRRLLTTGAVALAAPAILPRRAFSQQAKVIRIGGAVPLSGPVAYWGQSTAQGFDDGAAVINEAGGVMIGGEPHMLEIISYDTKGEVADSRAATLRLVEQDGCKYVFSQAAASNVGMLQVTEPAGVLSIVACWGYLDLFGRDYPLHFRAEMSDYEQGFAYIPFMQEKYGKDALKSAAFIGPNDQDGTDCHFSYERLMNYYGIGMKAVEYFNWEDTDFYPIVAKTIADRPDFIVTSPSPPGITASIIKAARELGYTGPISSPAASETSTILEVAGEHADGVVLPVTNVTPSTDTQKAIEKRFLDRFGTFNALAGNYSWWIYSLKAAWEMAGTAEDTKAVAEALAQVELEDTYVGKVKWGGEKSFGVARQGIYDCYTTTIDKGVAQVEDIRFPALPDDY
ncbi:MAG: ABC transporter substrate-binding protein [Paracoccaceae bacterium]|jgi:branched-chain amino acid transport system substrate-binding protein|nr:ABC transporter substrate-binding protein [Rhodobacter sp.]